MRFFLLFAVSLPLVADCSYVFQTSSTYATSSGGYIQGYSNLPAAGYSDNITVTAVVTEQGAACGWSYNADSAWITFTGPTSGSMSSGTLTFTIAWTAAANLTGLRRTGHINFSATGLGVSIPVAQLGVPCTLTVGATSASFGVGGGSGSIPVQTSCNWSASGSQSWIAIPPNTNGTGNGTVSYTVTANVCVAGRSGSIAVSVPGVSNANVSITQDGSQGNLTLSSTSITLPATASTGRFTVSAGDGCAWPTVYSDTTWLTITGVGQANSTGPVGYSVPANTGAARTGAIHVGSQTFTVTQQSGISLPTPVVATVQNAASYAQGAVSPGEIVSIFGVNLGPKTGVALQVTPDGQFITTTLGGTQVLFDGTAAALTYVSATQVNAVVPYEVAGEASTQLQIAYQGYSSTPQSLPVQPVTPGIFSLDGNGIGPGAILNQDYAINGSGNRASAGSVVQIFCNGGGVTNPASADASITTGTPALVAQPVVVTIGGIPAQVTYAGGAPGAVAGLTQINAMVPNGVASGPVVPITVQIGGTPAQAGVTVSIQ